MKNKIVEKLEQLYTNEYGYAHPIQTRPEQKKGFTGEDPEKGQEDQELSDDKVEKEKEKRKKELEKDKGDVSGMSKPTKKGV